MEEEKDQLFNEILCYNGKILKSKGTRKDKDNNDINWKLWNLTFDSGRSYDWKCSMFGNYDTEGKPLECKGVHITDMVEGNYYEVVYKVNEYVHKEHGQVKSKQAVLIKESEESKCTKGNSKSNQQEQGSQAQAVSSSSPKAVPDNFVAFAKEYKEAVGDVGDAMHMLGAYVLNKHTEQFSNIIELCKKEFK